MPRNDRNPTGQQPEALRSLEAAAKAGSKKPREQELEARGDTAPKPASLEAEQQAGAEALKAGAEGRPQDMDAASKKAPGR